MQYLIFSQANYVTYRIRLHFSKHDFIFCGKSFTDLQTF